MHSVHAPPRAELGGRVGREDYALPSINRDSGSAPLNSYSREPPSRLEDYSGPAQSYSGVGSAYQASSPVQTPYQHYGVAQSGAYSYPSGQHATRSPYEEGNDSAQYPLNFEAVGDFGEATHRRRPGRNLPKHVTDILRTWFSDHIAHPYPTEDEKQMLMGRTGLTISQISNWFINARRRSLPQMTKQAQAEAELRDSQGRHPR
ncbi:hypothetical protein MMC24_000833 [Lignoscripta atroalba]|nr:hypothetical protein [Lignoscripta atroalba]